MSAVIGRARLLCGKEWCIYVIVSGSRTETNREVEDEALAKHLKESLARCFHEGGRRHCGALTTAHNGNWLSKHTPVMGLTAAIL